MEKHFYHLFANGDDAKGLIISERDFIFEFNLMGICSHHSGVTVAGFSIEDTHPHALLYGYWEQCLNFAASYELSSLRHIAATRGSTENVHLSFELIQLDNEDHLLNTAAYVIIQPTKDGKPVQYYDYYWGTGSMYFREKNHISIWRINKDGIICEPVKFGQLTWRQKDKLCPSKPIPDDWLVCNGIILPENYVNVQLYEKIFHTHNRFRTFAGAGKKQTAAIIDKMAEARGIMMDDLEARNICNETSQMLFGTKDIRRMDMQDRYILSKELRQKYAISLRQLAFLVKIPESELRKYIR